MKNKRLKILVTGGTGFIGSNIVDAYIKEGYGVIVVDNLSTGKKENLNPKAKFYLTDIADKKQIARIFEKERPYIVNHHAAQIDVRKSVSNPIFDAKNNIIGTLNILENCKKCKVKKIIFASSGGVIYGECGDIHPNEDSTLSPVSPYGIGKLADEYYIKFYGRVYKIKFTIFRYGNVYGPRQDPNGEAGVVAIFINKMRKNLTVNIFGTGKQLRDYVYIGDIVDLNLKCLYRGDNDIFNVGMGNNSSVNQIFEILSKIMYYKKKPIYKSERAGELFKSSLDVKKVEKVVGWIAKTDLFRGLKKTVEYFSVIR